MTSLYDERRAKIKLENHTAKKLLKNNLENFKLSDYTAGGDTMVPRIIKGMISKPAKTISTADMITRRVLPERNLIRRFFKMLSSTKRVFQLFFNK